MFFGSVFRFLGVAADAVVSPICKLKRARPVRGLGGDEREAVRWRNVNCNEEVERVRHESREGSGTRDMLTSFALTLLATLFVVWWRESAGRLDTVDRFILIGLSAEPKQVRV